MKQYDTVRLIRDRERYAKDGIKKGMLGKTLDQRSIKGQWLIYFVDINTGEDIGDAAILEEDLEVVAEA